MKKEKGHLFNETPCILCRTPEESRLEDDAWRQWGPYLSERQWGVVREDHSLDGNW